MGDPGISAADGTAAAAAAPAGNGEQVDAEADTEEAPFGEIPSK